MRADLVGVEAEAAVPKSSSPPLFFAFRTNLNAGGAFIGGRNTTTTRIPSPRSAVYMSPSSSWSSFPATVPDFGPPSAPAKNRMSTVTPRSRTPSILLMKSLRVASTPPLAAATKHAVRPATRRVGPAATTTISAACRRHHHYHHHHELHILNALDHYFLAKSTNSLHCPVQAMFLVAGVVTSCCHCHHLDH